MNRPKSHFATKLKLAFTAVFFFCSVAAWCALPTFMLTVTPVDEICTGNGALNFSVSNTAAGASITYSVYQLPNVTTPIATLTGSTLTGLSAGNYRVVATQALGSETNTQQADAEIFDLLDPLSFNLSAGADCSGGKITVSVFSGVPVTYEIIAGPVIVAPQTSNIFAGLPAGIYQVRVFDQCGEGLVQTITLVNTVSNITIGQVNFPSPTLPDCDLITVVNGLSVPLGFSVAYPLNVTYTVHPPSGPDLILNSTVSSGGVSRNIPFFAGQQYTYDLQITDNCGNTYTRLNNVVNQNLAVQFNQPLMGCGYGMSVSAFNFKPPFMISFLSAPAGFDPTVFNATHPGGFSTAAIYYSATAPLPNGTYQVQITDGCGRTAVSTTQFFQTIPGNLFNSSVYKGCDPDRGSIRIFGISDITSAVILTAPAAYATTLPHDVSFNIVASNGDFLMNNLPVGNYVFHLTDACGNQLDKSVTILPLQVPTTDVAIAANCASFNLTLTHTDNLGQQPSYFWLQKFNPNTGLWCDPETGVVYNGAPSDTNSYQLNIGNNLNLPFSGEFRILKSFPIYGNGAEFNNGTPANNFCVLTIYGFELKNAPAITAVYSFACGNGTTDVVVQATGLNPLAYRITLKNGNPFVVENGNNAVFANLEPAIYNFQIQDACGNILNRLFDITQPVGISITPSALCNGQPGSLVLPNLPFLTYSWWKGDDGATILSTTNMLAFTSFNAATDSGTYHVHVAYPNANSCIDLTLDFVISASLKNPHAGNDGAANYCGDNGMIDLFDLLSGTVDDFGQWHELSSSGALNGNLWNSDGVPPGNYTFQYTVNGLCGAVDESMVEIAIAAIPEAPFPFLEQDVCDGRPLQLLATTVANASYQWTGPNNFSSTEQNPLIGNISLTGSGSYSVVSIVNGCSSEPAFLQINVLPQIDFTIKQACIGSAFTLTALPASGENPDVAYEWSGPDNFSATGNPVVVTGNAGEYSVTAVAQGVCGSQRTFVVSSAICDIPKGVSVNGDGWNDTFDLAGLNVEYLKIFNRYGMVVFEGANYNDQWRGQDKNGNQLPTATYYYAAQLPSGETRTGWVYLITKS